MPFPFQGWCFRAHSIIPLYAFTFILRMLMETQKEANQPLPLPSESLSSSLAGRWVPETGGCKGGFGGEMPTVKKAREPLRGINKQQQRLYSQQRQCSSFRQCRQGFYGLTWRATPLGWCRGQCGAHASYAFAVSCFYNGDVVCACAASCGSCPEPTASVNNRPLSRPQQW